MEVGIKPQQKYESLGTSFVGLIMKNVLENEYLLLMHIHHY